MKIHHVGYLVKKIDKAAAEFERLGFSRETGVVEDNIRHVDICFMQKDGYRVELVSPASGESDVQGLIKKFGNSPYHICYETESFEADIERLQSEHYVMCKEPEKAPALSGKRVCFLISAALGMIELLEK